MVDTFLSPRTGRQNGYKRDLVVIVDSSGSIGSSDFDIAKDELAMLLGFICPKGDPFSNDIHQAALIRYSNAPIEIFDFYAHQDTSKLQQSIRDMPYSGGSTCTGDAFNYVLTETFTPQKGMRNEPDVKHELLILTDGQSNCGRDATVEAIRLQDANIDVFGLMIGSLSQSGRSELETYVSDVETHLFSVDNFRDLTLLLNMVELVQQVVPCVSFDTGK